jgi:hypothetical protein
MDFLKSAGCIFVLILLAAPAGSDECESYGPVASIDAPKSGSQVPRNVHFRLGLYPTCGALEGGPQHRFRIVNQAGQEAESQRIRLTKFIFEIEPSQPLETGDWKLQVKRPEAQWSLGAWETLSRVKVARSSDRQAPKFAGISLAQADAVAGLVALSPCQVETDWVVSTRLYFLEAKDAGRQHDELLYFLDRKKPKDSRWTHHSTFRPHKEKTGMSFSFNTERAWEQTWQYRIRVRDLAGNETIGDKTFEVVHPARPDRPVPKQ